MGVLFNVVEGCYKGFEVISETKSGKVERERSSFERVLQTNGRRTERETEKVRNGVRRG